MNVDSEVIPSLQTSSFVGGRYQETTAHVHLSLVKYLTLTGSGQYCKGT